MIVKAILGVLLISAFVGWQAWRFCKHGERMERDSRYRRRWFYLWSGLFVLPVIIVGSDVVRGHAHISQLLGAPIALGAAWFFFQAARRVESPSKADIPNKTDQ